MPDRAARRVLEAWTDRLQPAETALAHARWEAAVQDAPERREAVAAAARALEARAQDETGMAKVAQSLEERIDDPLLRRAMERLRLRLLPHRAPRPEALLELEAEVPGVFAGFRARMGDERLDAHQLGERLRETDDAADAERAWRATAALGTDLAPRVREMTRLRGEHARACGSPDFRRLRLEVEELPAATLDAMLDELERGTDEAWAARKAELDRERATRFGIPAAELAPWHYGDLFLQRLPRAAARADPFATLDPLALSRKTFEGLGLPVESILERSDLEPREGKNPHAFCTHLDREGDVRVLANVRPSARWTRTLLHELGHAVYELGLDPELPWILRRPPHAATTEGVAMLFGRLVEEPKWRQEVAGLAPDEDAEARRQDDLLCFVRWGLVMCRFEAGLHEDPDRDLDDLWWTQVERIQGIRRPEDPPEGLWAAKIHFALWPSYYHAYLLGEMIASRLGAHVRRNVFGRGLVANPPAGTWLVERVFRPGAALRWERHIEEASQGRLAATDLLADVTP